MIKFSRLLKVFFLISSVMLLFGCAPRRFSAAGVEIDTLFSGKFSIRAILIDSDKIWYGAEKGKYGYYDLQLRKSFHDTINDVKTEFRSIASNGKNVFLLNAGSPATLFKLENGAAKLVFVDNDPKVFFDSMAFSDPLFAVAVGDPMGKCFTILSTSDGGNTWRKHDCANSPVNLEGEAAFAASNSNIAIIDNTIWIATGGKAARVFKSSNRGQDWNVFQTPMVQGREMTGTFSCDFYDSKNGILVGGDYENPTSNAANKAVTSTGGRLWNLVSENSGFGYASCVRYVPGSKARKILSVGATGIWGSGDRGSSWTQLSNDPDLYTIRFIDSRTAIAAGKNKLIKIRF